VCTSEHVEIVDNNIAEHKVQIVIGIYSAYQLYSLVYFNELTNSTNYIGFTD
jgi:hypothetical protein